MYWIFGIYDKKYIFYHSGRILLDTMIASKRNVLEVPILKEEKHKLGRVIRAMDKFYRSITIDIDATYFYRKNIENLKLGAKISSSKTSTPQEIKLSEVFPIKLWIHSNKVEIWKMQNRLHAIQTKHPITPIIYSYPEVTLKTIIRIKYLFVT